MSHPSILPDYVSWAHDIRVQWAFGSFLASDLTPPMAPRAFPEDPPEGLLPLTFWSDGRALASRWYRPTVYEAVQKSPLFGEPLTVALVFRLPAAHPGWTMVDVTAVAASDEQLWSVLRLAGLSPWSAPIVHAGAGRPALHLGHRWFPRSPELTGITTDGPEARQAFADHAEALLDHVLYGAPADVAARLFDSIPGIRGERRDIQA